jgi:hypothetical protein
MEATQKWSCKLYTHGTQQLIVLGYGNVVCWTYYNQIVEFALCGWLGGQKPIHDDPIDFLSQKNHKSAYLLLAWVE